MKVVQINAVYRFSSTGRTVMELHQNLRERGDESWVFCTNCSDAEQNIFLIGNKLDHKIHAFMSRLLGLQGYFSIVATKRLLRQLDTIKPDVVHLHNLHANYINFPLFLNYLSSNNIVTVITLHDCWFFTGHCCHYTEKKCVRWMTGCGHCPTLKDYNKSWFFDRTKKIFRDKKRLFAAIPRMGVVGNSEWTTTQARTSFLKNAKIVVRIYNWINLETFYPRLVERENKFTVLGVAQGWSEKKGLSVFFNIARRFSDCKVILVGSFESPVDLLPNIDAVGAINSTDELAIYYSGADVFVSCSIQETFGNVSAEALACGTPIVVNNATANPELVGEGCGYVADNNDIESYYRAIEEIRRHGRKYYSEKCRVFAQKNFSMKKNINEYVDLYRELLW